MDNKTIYIYFLRRQCGGTPPLFFVPSDAVNVNREGQNKHAERALNGKETSSNTKVNTLKRYCQTIATPE